MDTLRASNYGLYGSLKVSAEKEAEKATLEWFRKQPAERQAKLRAGITAEREAQVLAAWKARKP